MSNNSNGKTWADFFSENKPLVWFMIITLFFLLGFLIYNKWGLKYGSIVLTPPITIDSIQETSDKNKKSSVKRINPNLVSKADNKNTQTSKPIELGKEDVKTFNSFMLGTVFDSNGKPASNAKITCDNCLTSDTPKYSDELGKFRISYQIEYKINEYSLKSLELSILYNNKIFSVSQNISQNSLIIELK